MERAAQVRHRRSIRLRGWDYSADGAYFLTVCTDQRAHILGDIVDGQMRLNPTGEIAAETWRWLASQYPHVVVDEWCVMPNHLHGILVLTGRGGSRTAPTDAATRDADVRTNLRKPIGRLIGAFKTFSTKQINRLRNTPGAAVWQRDFWERVVRDDDEMDRIRVYIRQNPANWTTDDLNK